MCVCYKIEIYLRKQIIKHTKNRKTYPKLLFEEELQVLRGFLKVLNGFLIRVSLKAIHLIFLMRYSPYFLDFSCHWSNFPLKKASGEKNEAAIVCWIQNDKKKKKKTSFWFFYFFWQTEIFDWSENKNNNDLH